MSTNNNKDRPPIMGPIELRLEPDTADLLWIVLHWAKGNAPSDIVNELDYTEIERLLDKLGA